MPQPFPPNIGPKAPERNPPIHPEYFLPRVFVISAIALGTSTTVTTSLNHDYVVGQNIRFLIPDTYGTRQLNERTGLVTSIPAANQVVVDINSNGMDAFIPSPTFGPTPPQIVAIGDVNTGAINTTGRINTGTFIEGSFINISPI